MVLSSIKNIFKPKADNKHITVLIIEDGKVDQKVACAAVEQGGYSVLQAWDGQTGLSMARQHKPNFIILDYNLPDMQGPDICKILKRDEETKSIPVLFLTSMDTPTSIINCYEQGGENYLAKPISPKMLLKQIQLILKDVSQQET